MSAVLAHLIFAGLVLVCYTALTIAGHDANPLFALLVGQAAGGGIQKAADKTLE